MSTPTEPTTDPTAGNPPAEPEPTALEADDLPDPEGADQLGDPGKRALAAMKEQLREEKRLRTEQAARLKEFEDRDKTEAERLAERATAAEERAASAVRRAVAAEVKALAAGQFADPEDAVGALDPAKYLDDSGEIDAEQIRADLAALLERKPHWAKVPEGPRVPRPDPGQGPRPGSVAGGVDDQIAEAQAKRDWRTAMRLQNSKLADAATK